jgi:hypothetical protein
MAFSMFFLASPRCAAGEPVSLGCEAEGKPLVVRDGRRVMVSSIVRFLLKCKECGDRTYGREEGTE